MGLEVKVGMGVGVRAEVGLEVRICVLGLR